MSSVHENLTVEQLSTLNRVVEVPTTTTVSASTLALTSTSTKVQVFTGTVAGQFVNLPDATTLQVGWTYRFINTSNQIVTIRNSASTRLADLQPNDIYIDVVLVNNGTAAGVWQCKAIPSLDPLTNAIEFEYTGKGVTFDDFTCVAVATATPSAFVAATANGGNTAFDTVAYDGDSDGIVSLNTGTTNNATGRALFLANNGSLRLRIGGSPTWYESRVLLPVLSSGTQRYRVYSGFTDTNGAGQPVNFVGFQYIDNENSGRWRCIARQASTSTILDSTVTLAADTWYTLRWFVPADRSRVDFYIKPEADANFQLIGSVTTNLPAATTNLTPFFKIEKEAITTNVSRQLKVDWAYWRKVRA